VKGQKAVAEVVFPPHADGNYGHSICAVVYEGADKPGCQFSFACNGELSHGKSPQAMACGRRSWRLRILTGERAWGDATGGANELSRRLGTARLGQRLAAHGADRQPHLLQERVAFARDVIARSRPSRRDRAPSA